MSRLPRIPRSSGRGRLPTAMMRRLRLSGLVSPGPGAGDPGGGGPPPAAAFATLWADLDGLGAGVADFGGAGTNQYYLTGSPVIPTDKTAYTVHVLFRPAATGSIMSLVDQRPLDGGTTLTAGRLRVLANGTIEAIARDVPNAAIIANAAGAVAANAWALATLVRSGGTLSCYRDGANKATASGTMPTTPGGVAAIGGFRSAWPATDLFNGRIMFVDVIDGAQSDAEVAAYHAALGTLGSGWPPDRADRINRIDLIGPACPGYVDPSVVARAFNVPAFLPPASEPPTLQDAEPNVPVLRLGGWTFPPGSAPTLAHTPARLVGGGVMSGSKAGAHLIGAAAPATVGFQVSPDPPPATQQLYAEILPDGSGLTLSRTAADRIEAKRLAPGGSVAATWTSADTLYGRRVVSASSKAELSVLWHNQTADPVPVTRYELTIGSGPADLVRFGEGDKFRILGDANFAGEYAISEAIPAEGKIRFVLDEHGLPAPPAPGSVVESAGKIEHTPTSGDAPRYAGLRAKVSGDAIEVYNHGHPVGSGTLAGLSGLSPEGVVRYLGTHPGSPDAAPTFGLCGFAEGSALSAGEEAEFDARIGALIPDRVGWARDQAAAWIGDLPGTVRYSRILDEREVVYLEPDGRTPIGGGWTHPDTGQGYGRGNGVAVLRDVGDMALASPATYPIHAALCRRPYDHAGGPNAPAALYAGPIGEVERRPLSDPRWRHVYIDQSLGNDANAGTEAAPWQTITPLMRTWSPYTCAWFRRGRTYATGGAGASHGPDMDDLGFQCRGPVRFETYGPESDGRAVLDYPQFRIDLKGFGFRMGPGFQVTQTISTGSIIKHAYIDLRHTGTGGHVLATRWRNVLFDLFSEDPAIPHNGYGILIDGANSWLVGIVRAHFAAGVVGTGNHAFRTQGAVGIECALGTRVDSLTGDTSFRQLNWRHGLKDCVVTDLIEPARAISTSADGNVAENHNGVHAGVRFESCVTRDVSVQPTFGLVVAHYAQSISGATTPNATTFASPPHRMGTRDMVALATKTRVTGANDPWSRFTLEPLAGPLRNVNNGDGSADFGPIAMPSIPLAAASRGGMVLLQAEGYPLGGTGLVALRMRRRPAAGGAWEAVPGSGRRVMSDRPGPGSYVYSTYCGDDPGAPDASGAESDPVAVA